MGVLLAFFNTSCEKEPTPTKPHSNTYTFYYDIYGVPSDTIRAHMDADTFFVVPIKYDLFAHVGEANIHNVRIHLEGCQRLNPRVRGKGRFRAPFFYPEDSIWLSNFGYNVER